MFDITEIRTKLCTWAEQAMDKRCNNTISYFPTSSKKHGLIATVLHRRKFSSSFCKKTRKSHLNRVPVRPLSSVILVSWYAAISCTLILCKIHCNISSFIKPTTSAEISYEVKKEESPANEYGDYQWRDSEGCLHVHSPHLHIQVPHRYCPLQWVEAPLKFSSMRVLWIQNQLQPNNTKEKTNQK